MVERDVAARVRGVDAAALAERRGDAEELVEIREDPGA
jgi:hypothetical protein